MYYLWAIECKIFLKLENSKKNICIITIIQRYHVKEEENRWNEFI